MTKIIKILVGKMGLDGHDRGAKLLCHYLRDAGMEVIYSGIRKTPKNLVSIAAQEDVDIIGISILSGAHNVLIPLLFECLAEKKLEIPVIVGGIIPQSDVKLLLSYGVKHISTPGSNYQEIIGKIYEICN